MDKTWCKLSAIKYSVCLIQLTYVAEKSCKNKAIKFVLNWVYFYIQSKIWKFYDQLFYMKKALFNTINKQQHKVEIYIKILKNKKWMFWDCFACKNQFYQVNIHDTSIKNTNLKYFTQVWLKIIQKFYQNCLNLQNFLVQQFNYYFQRLSKGNNKSSKTGIQIFEQSPNILQYS